MQNKVHHNKINTMIDILKKITLLSVLCLCCCGVTYAQKVKKVTGTYTYVLPQDISREQGKHIALERAKEDAINSAFGQIIARENLTRINMHNGETTTDFSSLGQSLTRGEWVETIGEPKFDIGYDEIQDCLIITCTVKGRVREIVAAKAEFEWKVLRNIPDSKFESYEFKDGDQLFISFMTPKDGYIAIYLIDAENNANCLIPYASDADGYEYVNHGEEYIFFAPTNNDIDDFIVDTSNAVDAIRLYCNGRPEINQIRIIFSPNPFTKPIDHLNTDSGIYFLPLEKFENWLLECQRNDSQMSVDARNVNVSR